MSRLRNSIDRLPPVHPGAILKETLEDVGLSMNQLARSLRVSANRVSAIVSAKRAITGETALRLARYFDTTPEYWMNLQARYELESARDAYEAEVRAQVRPRSAA